VSDDKDKWFLSEELPLVTREEARLHFEEDFTTGPFRARLTLSKRELEYWIGLYVTAGQ
jgi:hypothetical protein